MGTLVDTTVFIDMERALAGTALPGAMRVLSARLQSQVGEGEELGMATITVSDLLHGVHRATPRHRAQRLAFVEQMVTTFPPQPFDVVAARTHAEIWAHLSASGRDVGDHDRIVAATALSLGWQVATADVGHFDRVPGLTVVPVCLAVPAGTG